MCNRLKVSSLFSRHSKIITKNGVHEGKSFVMFSVLSHPNFKLLSPPAPHDWRRRVPSKKQSFWYRELRSFRMRTQEWKLISVGILSFLSCSKVLHGIVIFLDYWRNFHMMIKIETAACCYRASKFWGEDLKWSASSIMKF